MNTETIRSIQITFSENDASPGTHHAHLHLPGGRVATSSQRLFANHAAWRESWLRIIDCAVGPTDERRRDGIDGAGRPWWPSPSGTRWVRCNKPRGWRWQPVDLGVADLVEGLQTDRGATTTASCDGTHGGSAAHVVLADGRVLLVCDTVAQFEDLSEYRRCQAGIFGRLFGSEPRTRKAGQPDVPRGTS